MLAAIAALGGMNPRVGGARPVTNGGVTAKPVSTAVPVMKGPYRATPLSPLQNPLQGPIVQNGGVLGLAPGTMPRPTAPIATPYPVRGTVMSPGGATPAPVNAPTTPISTFAPTIAPSSGGTIQSQPTPPPSGAPPSITIGQAATGTSAPSSLPAGVVNAPSGFPVGMGWIVLLGVVAIVAYVISKE